MAFVKLLMTGDAAALSTELAHDVGTVDSAGVATDASKHDHVHMIGSGAIATAAMFLAGIVNSSVLGANCIWAGNVEGAQITSSKIDVASVAGYQFSQIIFTPKIDGDGAAEGTVFYDSDDDHLYLYTA